MIGLSQDDPLRAMFKGLGFDDAREKIGEVFQDIFDMHLDAKKPIMVWMRPDYLCEKCGHEGLARETDIGDVRDERLRKMREQNGGTSPNP